MKTKTFLFILVTIIILLILPSKIQIEPKEIVENMTFITNSDLFFDYEVTKYPTKVEITSTKFLEEGGLIGVVVDPWNLNFGIVPTGGSSVKRQIELFNTKEKAGKISFKVYGDISPLVSFSDNDFIIHENENLTVMIYLNTGNLIGNYSGEIDVVAKKPKYKFLYPILEWI